MCATQLSSLAIGFHTLGNNWRYTAILNFLRQQIVAHFMTQNDIRHYSTKQSGQLLHRNNAGMDDMNDFLRWISSGQSTAQSLIKTSEPVQSSKK